MNTFEDKSLLGIHPLSFRFTNAKHTVIPLIVSASIQWTKMIYSLCFRANKRRFLTTPRMSLNSHLKVYNEDLARDIVPLTQSHVSNRELPWCVTVNSLHVGLFFGRLLIFFFIINHHLKNGQEYHQSAKQFARHFARPDLDTKGYQQTTPVDKEFMWAWFSDEMN